MQKTKSFDEISYSLLSKEFDETSNENPPILMYLDGPLPSQTDSLDQVLDSLPKSKKRITKRKKCDFHTKKRKKMNRKNLVFEKHTPFTFEEDEKILNLVIEHGPRFQIISQFFLDRSQNAVKNRYYKFLRYNWDLILGRYTSCLFYSNYQHLNYVVEDSILCQSQSDEIKNFLEDMNFYPEVTDIMLSLITRVDNHFR
ncbi:unnamed protein product (macronuclear) [Paramecium tetraurelia]|uniref:Uncharacterized protein n=1 Tax=Paramecium tetraurelia TaxID=5888 RepID=A0D6S2_PARTE|nr:uncharacterized protein GSPATT00001780001 [Paramecium tetraurelia]CAK78739.1 unnamed protein product [Paramecium tetraurelia]|eukprot:XP_001446136.1 hypothetical protein (macronuclear) [Paramecium tetraurelia strain d4-2]